MVKDKDWLLARNSNESESEERIGILIVYLTVDR